MYFLHKYVLYTIVKKNCKSRTSIYFTTGTGNVWLHKKLIKKLGKANRI
jgi:hypothetical protein